MAEFEVYGSGIYGAFVAHEFSERGESVLVKEMLRDIGGYTTKRNHFNLCSGTRYALFDIEFARYCLKANNAVRQQYPEFLSFSRDLWVNVNKKYVCDEFVYEKISDSMFLSHDTTIWLGNLVEHLLDGIDVNLKSSYYDLDSDSAATKIFCCNILNKGIAKNNGVDISNWKILPGFMVVFPNKYGESSVQVYDYPGDMQARRAVGSRIFWGTSSKYIQGYKNVCGQRLQITTESNDRNVDRRSQLVKDAKGNYYVVGGKATTAILDAKKFVDEILQGDQK